MKRLVLLVLALMSCSSLTLLAQPRVDEKGLRGLIAPLIKGFKAFSRLDANQDGVLDDTELARVRRPEIREKILALDLDKDGRVTKAELRDKAIVILKEIAEKLPISVMRRFDLDHDGTITLDEAKKGGAKDGMLRALAGFDLDGDQRLSSSEFKAVEPAIVGIGFKSKVSNLKSLLAQPSISDPPGKEFLRFVVDLDGDGKVTPAELEAFLNKSIGEKAVQYATGKMALPGPPSNNPRDNRPDVPMPKTAAATSKGDSSIATTTARPIAQARQTPQAPPAARLQTPTSPSAPDRISHPSEPKAPETPTALQPPPPPSMPAKAPVREVLFPGGQGSSTSVQENELEQDILGSDADNDMLW